MSAAERISTRVRWTPEEQEARVGLAAAYRLFAQLGWHELIYNHITVKVPGTEHFLINPFGLMYRQVKASNLVKIDLDGAIVGPASYPINPAGFVVHAAVHRARADVGCVMHTHTTAGLAVACQADGLLPLSFPSMFYTDRLAYHDFEGVTVDESECDRLAADLGDRYAMILRNHGLLACGRDAGRRVRRTLPPATRLRGADRGAEFGRQADPAAACRGVAGLRAARRARPVGHTEPAAVAGHGAVDGRPGPVVQGLKARSDEPVSIPMTALDALSGSVVPLPGEQV